MQGGNCAERYFCNIVEYQRSVLNEYKKKMEEQANEIAELKGKLKEVNNVRI